MAYHSETIRSVQQRWRDAGSISCFSWPLSEVTSQTLVKTGIGNEVLAEHEMLNWRDRISRGLSATTTFEAEECTLEYAPGHIFLGKWCGGSVNRYGYFQKDGDLFSGSTSVWNRPPAAPSIMDSKTRDEALSYAIKDARSKQTHFRGGNFLAELADTIRGLRNPVKGFRGLLDAYHRNGRKRVKRAVGRRSLPRTQEDFRRLERDSPDVARAAQRALGDSWLEANFGWQPLLSDAVSAYQGLRRLATRIPLARFSGFKENDDPPTYASGTINLQITPMDWTVRTETKYTVHFYGAVKIEVSQPTSAKIEEFGVRARDFLPAVWEAIPYSFLIDYFSNIGDIIETVSFPRSDLAWISRTFRNHTIRSTEQVAIAEFSDPAFPASNSNKVFAFQSPRVKWDRKYVSRTAYSDSIVPSLRFEIPGSKNWKKWCNIAALARLRTL